MVGRNNKFNFFHRGFNREGYTGDGGLDFRKLIRVLVQTSDGLKIPKQAINYDSSRVSNSYFLGINKLDSIHQGFNGKLKTCRRVF